MTVRVVICGGGAIAHCLAGLIGAAPDARVVVLTRRPDDWSNCILVHHSNEVVAGAVAPTADPSAVSEADLVLVAAPAFAHGEIVARLHPFLAPGTWIGALPIVGPFDKVVRATMPDHQRILGSLRAPYNARVAIYGREVVVSGVAPTIDLVSACPDHLPTAARLIQSLLSLPVRGLTEFQTANLAPSGTIFHAARIAELLVRPDPEAERFYRDWGEAAARLYLAMDEELAMIRRALACDAPGLDAQSHYGVSTAAALAKRIRSLPGLPDIAPPFRDGRLDPLHRFLREDLPFGLSLAIEIAASNHLEAPAMTHCRNLISTALAQPR